MLVPRLILQPLVENAVRHGIARRPRGGFILVKAHRKGEQISVLIENEPPEESAAILLDGVARTGGIGIRNVRQRLEQMYGEKSAMHTSTNARGNFEVAFAIPIVRDQEMKSYKIFRTTDEV